MNYIRSYLASIKARFLSVTKKDYRDVSLLFLATCLLPLLSCGSLSLAGVDPSRYAQFGIEVDLKGVLNPSVFFPAVLLFAFIFIFLLRSRWSDLSQKKVRLFLSIALLFATFRLVAVLSFPYGNVALSFQNPVTGKGILVDYPGFSALGRVESFLSDSLFFCYFAILFLIAPTLSNALRLWSKGILIALVLLGWIAILYSIGTEGDILVHNLEVAVNRIPDVFKDMTSFTNHRNVFGFLLVLAFFSAFLLFSYHRSIPAFLSMFVFYLFSFVLYSRTTILLLFIGFNGLLLFYPILMLKTRWKQAIILWVVFVLQFVVVLILIQVFSSHGISGFFEFWKRRFQDQGTMDSRHDITAMALSMLNNPFLLLFGYSRSPFVTIFSLYRNDPTLSVVINSHNAYADILMHYGIIGCLFVLLGAFFLVYRLLKMAEEKSFRSLFVYGLLFFVFGIYGLSECHFPFLDDTSSVLVILVVLFPFLSTKVEEADVVGFSLLGFLKELFVKRPSVSK